MYMSSEFSTEQLHRGMQKHHHFLRKAVPHDDERKSKGNKANIFIPICFSIQICCKFIVLPNNPMRSRDVILHYVHTIIETKLWARTFVVAAVESCSAVGAIDV